MKNVLVIIQLFCAITTVGIGSVIIDEVLAILSYQSESLFWHVNANVGSIFSMALLLAIVLTGWSIAIKERKEANNG